MAVTSRFVVERITRRLGLEPHEGPVLFLMGALFAILVCAYTIAKVLRDALFLAEFGALRLPYGYIGVALASVGFVWLESRATKGFASSGATRFNQYAAIGFSILGALIFPLERHWTSAWFYVWSGSQAMMLLPHFWVLALDVWDSRSARLVFPLLGGCGLIGGLAGGAIAGWSTPLVQRVGLMWILAGMLVVAHLLTRAVEAHRAQRPAEPALEPALSAWKIIRRSRYIQVFAVTLALSVVVTTLVDFQFKFFLQRLYPDPRSLTAFLGKFYAGLNALSLVFQLGAAAWLLKRLGLGASSALQPLGLAVLAAWTAVTTGWWVVVAMRWLQGVFSQTLAKSTIEIYYAALRPSERRRVKPAIDTLVERWSDAAVGVLLIVLLHALRVPITAIAIITAALAVAWLVLGLVVNRLYGRAFQEALSTPWIGPETVSEPNRIPSTKKSLLEALQSDDEGRIVLALKLSEGAGDPAVVRAVSECLKHPSPRVKAAAVEAMEAKRIPDRDGVITGFLQSEHEVLRRAAVGYLLSRNPRSVTFARSLLDSDDDGLRQYILDALFIRPNEARRAITPEWIDKRIASGKREDLMLAARALGAMTGRAPVARLRGLLAHPDVTIQRVALLSATRQPSRELLDVLIPLLGVPELSYETRQAIAAVGDAAVPALSQLLEGKSGAHLQSLASRTLAQIGTQRAAGALAALVRTSDVRLRHLGLRGLARIRGRTGRPVLSRSAAHRLFLRDLRDYRGNLDPAIALEAYPAPELRLLADSYRESAEMSLERALQALACWYEPKPLAGAFDRLKSRERAVASPALEYLEHILPRTIFGPVRRIFEDPAPEPDQDETDAERLAALVRAAWESGDDWLRACAARAARYTPGFDPRQTEGASNIDDPRVRAELETLARDRAPAPPGPATEIPALVGTC